MDLISPVGVFGSLSGTVTALFLQPLENIKMALMLPPKDLYVDRNIFMNLVRAQRYIFQKEGLRGFFKGTVSCVMRALIGSFYFFGSLRQFEKLTQDIPDSSAKNFLCSAAARIVSTIVSNPINVIETRFEMINFKGYSSILDGVRKIWRNEQPTVFLKGSLTSCFKEGTFAGLYYMLYSAFKEEGFSKLSAGLLGGLMSTGFSHPFEIIRAKLQTQGVRQLTRKQGLIEDLRYMMKNGGWFKGLTPRLIKKPLSNALTFVLLETLEELHQKTPE